MNIAIKEMLSDVIMFRPFLKERVGRIIVLDPVHHHAYYGEVIRIGPGYYDDKGRFKKTTLQPGDILMHENYEYMPVTVDGEDFKLMRERDVVAVASDMREAVGPDPLLENSPTLNDMRETGQQGSCPPMTATEATYRTGER